MLKNYLVNTCIFQSLKGFNEFNEPVFGSVETVEQYLITKEGYFVIDRNNNYIKLGEKNIIVDNATIIRCRLIDKFKQITNEKGDIVISSGIIQCIEPIKVGDLINDRKVISVTCMTGLDGVVGYKGYLQ